MPARPDRAAAAHGFTLLESMVALLVLSVGLLGVAALHGQALAASATAVHRTQAVTLAAGMADRIRAGRGSAPASPDLEAWQSEVARVLPGGTGRVQADRTVMPAQYTVTITWREPSAPDPVAFALTFRQQPGR